MQPSKRIASFRPSKGLRFVFVMFLSEQGFKLNIALFLRNIPCFMAFASHAMTFHAPLKSGDA
jgi:hypothetical protein